MSETLEDLEGVGPAVAAAIRARFPSDAAFFKALKDQDLEALLEVDGLSERRAVQMILRQAGEAAPDGFFGTPRARQLYEAILDDLGRFAATRGGRTRLRLLHPTTDRKLAARRRQDVLEARNRVAQLDREEVRRHLRRLHAPREPRPRLAANRLVVCESAAAARKLRESGLDRWVTVGDLDDLVQAAEHELCIFLYDGGVDLNGLDNVVELPESAALAAIHPPRVLAWFDENRAALESAAALDHLLGRPGKAAEALEALDKAKAASVTIVDLRRHVEDTQKELNLAAKQRISGLSLTGDEVLATLEHRVPPALQAVYDWIRQESRTRLRAATGLDVQPFLPGFPVAIDEEELERWENRLGANAAMQAYEAEARAARALAPLQAGLERDIRDLLAFDATFALGCFALHHNLQAAAEADGFDFDASVHLSLSGSPDIQPVAYRLGGAEPRLAVLTGANSGGKSTLLEHLAQLVIMNQMGLPVVGHGVQVPWVEAVHFVTARRGLDAGAFETFLRGFLPIVSSGSRKLILADEVESVTELEAAGRILGFFLDRAAATDSLAVVVTHMAPQVLRHTAAAVRVDGIEATGLDDQHRLVVDRTPRLNHLARSTPELIVRRLANTVKGAERALYESLLERFRQPEADPGWPALEAAAPAGR